MAEPMDPRAALIAMAEEEARFLLERNGGRVTHMNLIELAFLAFVKGMGVMRYEPEWAMALFSAQEDDTAAIFAGQKVGDRAMARSLARLYPVAVVDR